MLQLQLCRSQPLAEGLRLSLRLVRAREMRRPLLLKAMAHDVKPPPRGHSAPVGFLALRSARRVHLCKLPARTVQLFRQRRLLSLVPPRLIPEL